MPKEQYKFAINVSGLEMFRDESAWSGSCHCIFSSIVRKWWNGWNDGWWWLCYCCDVMWVTGCPALPPVNMSSEKVRKCCWKREFQVVLITDYKDTL